MSTSRELWSRRELIAQFVKRDVTVRYAQAVMGLAWALLMPLLIICSGLVFRVVVSTMSNTPVESTSVASLAVKALPWAFFSGSISLATQSILAHANLIGKVYFPRESIPIASVLGQGLDFVIGSVALAVAIPLLEVQCGWQALWVAPVVLLLLIFTVGCALFLSCANLFYRDVKYLVQVLLSFGVFATPVFFEPQMLGEKGARVLLGLPLSPFIQGLDVAVVRNHSLLTPLSLSSPNGPVIVWSPWMLLYMCALSFGTLHVGARVFRRASSRFAEMA